MIDKTLKERGSLYGKFSDVAKKSREIQRVIGTTGDDVIDEAIAQVCNKLARIACGSKVYIDSYKDIAGYMHLVVQYLEKESEEAVDVAMIRKEKINGNW